MEKVVNTRIEQNLLEKSPPTIAVCRQKKTIYTHILLLFYGSLCNTLLKLCIAPVRCIPLYVIALLLFNSVYDYVLFSS